MEKTLDKYSIGELLNKLSTASPEKLEKLEAMVLRRRELHEEQLATINQLRIAAIRSYAPYVTLKRAIKMIKDKLERQNADSTK